MISSVSIPWDSSIRRTISFFCRNILDSGIPCFIKCIIIAHQYYYSCEWLNFTKLTTSSPLLCTFYTFPLTFFLLFFFPLFGTECQLHLRKNKLFQNWTNDTSQNPGFWVLMFWQLSHFIPPYIAVYSFCSQVSRHTNKFGLFILWTIQINKLCKCKIG